MPAHTWRVKNEKKWWCIHLLILLQQQRARQPSRTGWPSRGGGLALTNLFPVLSLSTVRLAVYTNHTSILRTIYTYQYQTVLGASGSVLMMMVGEKVSIR